MKLVIATPHVFVFRMLDMGIYRSREREENFPCCIICESDRKRKKRRAHDTPMSVLSNSTGYEADGENRRKVKSRDVLGQPDCHAELWTVRVEDSLARRLLRVVLTHDEERKKMKYLVSSRR